jgi:hypothetical protein
MSDLDQPATKRDLIEWRQELRHELETLTLTLTAEVTQLKLILRAELADAKSAMIQWSVGTLIAMAGVITAIVAWLR